jgi:hypothetical protein
MATGGEGYRNKEDLLKSLANVKIYMADKYLSTEFIEEKKEEAGTWNE